MKKIKPLSALTALVMVFALALAPFQWLSAHVYASSYPTAIVTVDGQMVIFEDQPAIIVPPGHVLVPVRGVFEKMGFEVRWETATRMAHLTRHDITIVIPADLNSFVINTAIVTPSVPWRIINDRLMLPLRYIAEAAFGNAQWDNVNRVAMITTQGMPTPTPVPATPVPTATPTPPGATPAPTPAPSPRPLFTVRPWDNTTRHNITRTNTSVQGIQRTGILTRAFGAAEQREADSWIDINMTNLGATRLTGYIGRTGPATIDYASARVATIFGDGQVLQTFTVDGHTPIMPFSIDITGVTILRIHFQAIGPVNEGGVSLTAFGLYVH